MPLTPLSFHLNVANATIFRSNAVNAAIVPVKRRQRRCFSGSTPLKPLFFRLKAANAAIFPVQRS